MTNFARVIAISNQKGGVAKTTTAINLAAALAIADQRILLVDMDPQANLTSGIGLKGEASQRGTVYEALVGSSHDPRGFVLPSSVDHLFVVPADRQLTGAEIELVTLEQREHRLRRFLDGLRAEFDYIFIDSPPSLGLLTLNALVAADSVLIPLNCEYFALEGIADLMATIEGVRGVLNPDLAVEGVLLTMADERTNLGQQVSSNVREFFGDKVYRTVIPRNIRLGEAPSHGVPGIVYDPRSRGAEAYVALAIEFLKKDGRFVEPPPEPEPVDPPPAVADATPSEPDDRVKREEEIREPPAPPDEKPGEIREPDKRDPPRRTEPREPLPQADGDSGPWIPDTFD
jgi:chromosome partitioning protein